MLSTSMGSSAKAERVKSGAKSARRSSAFAFIERFLFFALRLFGANLGFLLDRRHTERKCEPDLDLPLFVGSRLPLTEDKEKTAHTLVYRVSHALTFTTNTERLRFFFSQCKLSRSTNKEKAKTLPFQNVCHAVLRCMTGQS